MWWLSTVVSAREKLLPPFLHSCYRSLYFFKINQSHWCKSCFHQTEDTPDRQYFESLLPIPNIANVRSFSLTLDGDGGIAAPKKKYCPHFCNFRRGGGIFLPFFLPVQQENCLLIESKDFLYSSRRAKLWFVWEWPTKVDEGWPF